MKLTYELLKKHNACEAQAAEFKRLFPDGCEPEIEHLTLLYAYGLDVF